LFEFERFAEFAVSSLPPLIVENSIVQLFFTEIGPESIGKVKLRIGTLPQQKITDPTFSSCSYQQIGIGKIAGGKIITYGFFVDIF